VTDIVTDVDPTLAAMQAGAEALRNACHAAYDAPRTPSSVYDRTGALYELLGRIEQLTGFLARDVERLAAEPRLRSTDGVEPTAKARQAAERLRDTVKIVETAETETSRGWSYLGTLYLAEET
jgi:hypothetical protein